MQCVHFYEFEIKVRLWRWARHGYQWCERNCTLAVRNNKLSSRGSRVYLIIIYGKISCVPCKVMLMSGYTKGPLTYSFFPA